MRNRSNRGQGIPVEVESLTQTLQLALAHHQAGRGDQAMTLYQEVLASNPNQPDALNLFGVLSFQMGDPKSALGLIGRALVLHPTHPNYCNNYGVVLESVGELQEATRYFQQALRVSPDYLEASVNLSDALGKLGRHLEAFRVLRQALRLHGAKPELYLQLGQFYTQLQSDDPHPKRRLWFHRARGYFQRALSLNPDSGSCLHKLGLLYSQNGEWDSAVSSYQEALRLMPDHPTVLADLGYSLTRTGEILQAARFLSRSMEFEPDNPQTRAFLVHATNLMMEQKAFLLHQTAKAQGNLAPISETSGEAWDVILFSPCSVKSFGGGQHPPQVARALQVKGHRVQFVELSVREEHQEAFDVTTDLFLLQDGPPTAFQRERMRNQLALFTQAPSCRRLVLFTVFSPYLVGLMEVFRESGYQTAYWCIDDWDHMRWPKVAAGTERALIRQVDYLFATSQVLAQKVSGIAERPCAVIRNGFSLSNFSSDGEKPLMPTDMRRGESKTFVYWGNLTADWIDWPLLKTLAERHPDWSFNMIGELLGRTDLLQAPNIHYLGAKTVGELASYGRNADIGFIHFKDSDLIRAVNPVKGYEYLACGLPIISTPMPELDVFPYVIQVKTPEAFEAAVTRVEAWKMDATVIDEFLKDATWAGRVEAFLAALGGADETEFSEDRRRKGERFTIQCGHSHPGTA